MLFTASLLDKTRDSGPRKARRSWPWKTLLVAGALCIFTVWLGVVFITISHHDSSDRDAEASSHRYAGEKVTWKSCGEASGHPLECTSITVPMDHFDASHRNSKVFRIPLIRLRGGEHATMNLLLNPGGPGGSGLRMLRRRGSQLRQVVGDGVHLLSFDPRGVGDSVPQGVCYPNNEVKGRLSSVRTQDAVHDSPEIILDAVSQRELLYWGFSYGAILGQTYAQMFPERSTRVVIDGVSSIFHWYGVESDRVHYTDAENTLRGFFSECIKAKEDCRLSEFGDTEDQLYGLIMDLGGRLKEMPMSVYVNNTAWGLLSFQNLFFNGILPALYRPIKWYDLAQNLAALLEGNATGAWQAYGEHQAFDAGDDSSDFIVNNDARSGPAYWTQDRMELLDDTILPIVNSSIFGPSKNLEYYIEQQWIVERTSDFVPKRNVRTAHPMLILSMMTDPVSPLLSATTTQQVFEDSRLVEIKGYGHCSYRMSDTQRRSHEDTLYRALEALARQWEWTLRFLRHLHTVSTTILPHPYRKIATCFKPAMLYTWTCMLRSSYILLSGLLGHAVAGCVITDHGSRSEIILRGTVLSPSGPLRGGYVYVRDGRIVRVGRQHEPRAATQHAAMIDCGSSVITPGFINTHEHLEYSLISPLLDNGDRYGSRNEWRVGVNNKTTREPQVVPGTEANATVWGELRHLFSGTTSILGDGLATGLVRNLDYVDGLGQDLQGLIDTMAVFPLDDGSGIVRLGDCDYGPHAVRQGGTNGLHRYAAHIGEGISAEAQNEFRCLSSETFDTTARSDGSGVSVDIIARNLVLIQANSLTEQDFDLVARRGAKVVWSPRSNIALYGSTLNVTYLLEAGITVALGTDWLPTGSATMSREAHCAVAAMASIYNIQLEAESLWQMMTIDAAKVSGFEQHMGSLEVGKLADMAIWGGDKRSNPYAQAIFSGSEDLELVMRGGKIMLAESALHPLLRADECEKLLVGAKEKYVCVSSELQNTSFAGFQSFMKDKYPAAIPGVPRDEPSCEPLLDDSL
ncbi:hypothetical protein BST61_g4200 [Cercospora zeina]